MWPRFFLLLTTLSFCLPLHASTPAEIDLRQHEWGQGEAFRLDGLWDSYAGELLTPAQLSSRSPKTHLKHPVPGVWGDKSSQANPLPALGLMTYQNRVLIPSQPQQYHLYIPDMPSAYRLWINGREFAHQGTVGRLPSEEKPAFGPKVLALGEHSETLDVVLQVSNFHYREGGIWFSLKLTDDSGQFGIGDKPLIGAVFFGAILLAIGLYNLSMFLFRHQETAALYFGLLCLVVGTRRLLIDERVLYKFDWFSWEVLQRAEHLCFYFCLPLFINFFASLYRPVVPTWTGRVSWALISPFVLICLGFTNRVYTELNVAFQLLVMISISFTLAMYIKAIITGSKNVRSFGISLAILALAVTHDVLKANGILSGANIAHFGVLAFVMSQSISLQRRYLKSLSMVEAMSSKLGKRNEELLRLDEFKDEFLATTSHELRTPLQGISGLAKVLKQDPQHNLDSDQKQKVELIANTSERLRVLVNDILDFSSIKHGKLKLHTGKVDLVEMAELVLGTMRGTLTNKTVSLSAHIDEDCRYLNADAFRLQQVLFNIMGNAVKYTEHGAIQLVARFDEEHLLLEIIDTGVGIPQEKQDRLFRPFEQTHVEGHFSASGTGLGLSISRKLVELHGGTLNLSSDVGKGTCVTLALPASLLINNTIVAQPKTHSLKWQTTPDTQSNTDRDKHTANPLIYAVDDEAINRELIASLLTSQGYRVETFSSGLEFLNAMTQHCPDLVVLDYMMPCMTGIEVCESVRQQFGPFELPIMMVTARHQVSDIVQALASGANDYLIKPFHDQELVARVRSQLFARKHWIANQENQKLRLEMQQRQVIEEQLEESNTQLLQALDLSHEFVLRLDQDFRVSYANRSATNHFDSDNKHSVIGVALSKLLGAPQAEQLSSWLTSTTEPAQPLSIVDNENRKLSAYARRLNHEGRSSYTVIFVAPALHQNNASLAMSNLHQELTLSRQRIEEIEATLKHSVLHDNEPAPQHNDMLKNEKSTSEELRVGLDEGTAPHKDNIAHLLRLSLSLWEQHTGKNKFELAEQSRCWRVYVDGTTIKARTFDRYLASKSVPDRPRWRAVVRTAHYVLGQCDISESDALQLKQHIQQVEELFA